MSHRIKLLAAGSQWLSCAWLLAACAGSPAPLAVNDVPDAAVEDGGRAPGSRCDRIEINGDIVLEHEQDLTATYRKGAPYTKTLMLFGGDPVDRVNTLSNAYIFGLDKSDAQMLAKKYPDFYLCSSVGGKEASKYILPYDLVPASCEIHAQLIAALEQYDENVSTGGDRTSLRIEGAPLTLVSVLADKTGEDLSGQLKQDYDFQLVTAVEQLTGESVLDFGTKD